MVGGYALATFVAGPTPGRAGESGRLVVFGRLRWQRGCVLAAVVAAALVLAGCGSKSANTATAPAAGPTSTPAADAATSTGSAPSTPITSPAAATPSPSTATEISIPPYLCDATDIAQNAADAYMGALSAGDEKQAAACVFPKSVPAAITHSLVATIKGTAVYLPRDGVDGPAVFGYQGNGKSIDVTVTKEKEGKFWVTKVTVRNA